MKPVFYAIIAAGLGMLLPGCKKDDFYMYSSQPAIYFYSGVGVNMPDSAAYNFILLPVTQTADTVYLPVRVQGFSNTADRTISYTVADSSTAVAGTHYTIGKAVLHAGRYVDSIPVYLKRTADMANNTLKLYVQLKPSADLEQGYSNHLVYKLTVTDRVVPPSWTYTLSSTFGAYSHVKFRFIVSVLQVTSFTGLLPSQAAAMATKCKLALVEYEAANGPLIDENGARVVFP
ncbi:hypothetical protein HNQ91_002642 [Filimonas zeae]|nr:DUF4843 domain-containing protein [Filimonas zeae]MDR6339591.1 hypothetical protein [Filimonas zeae]